MLVDEATCGTTASSRRRCSSSAREFLEQHPDVVEHLLEGHVAAVQWIADNPGEAPAVINAALEAETGKPLGRRVIERALEHVTFSVDPHADTFETLVANGLDAGTQKDGSIDGLFDLRILNGLLEAAGAEHRVGRRARRGSP